MTRPALGPLESDQAPPPPFPEQAHSVAQLAAASAPPKRPLTFGQKIVVGLVLIGFVLGSWVVGEAKFRARHPHYHHY